MQYLAYCLRFSFCPIKQFAGFETCSKAMSILQDLMCLGYGVLPQKDKTGKFYHYGQGPQLISEIRNLEFQSKSGWDWLLVHVDVLWVLLEPLFMVCKVPAVCLLGHCASQTILWGNRGGP